MSIPAVLVNYNYQPDWLVGANISDLTVYDRSDDDSLKYLQTLATERYAVLEVGKKGNTVVSVESPIHLYKTKNIGDVDYDKLGYLVEHYDDMPDVFLWGKTNILKYVDKDTLISAMKKAEFTPLLKQDHRTYSDPFGIVNYYAGNMYHERADSWFFNTCEHKYVSNWQEWCLRFGIPQVPYIPFPPGGNFILTKERVHRYSRDFYESMRDTLPFSMRPAEAQACERSYYLLWR